MVRRAALHVLLPSDDGSGASAGARRGARGHASDQHRGGAGSRASDDHGASPARLAGADQPQEGASDSQSERLAGAATAAWAATPCAGLGLAYNSAERTLGGGHDASLLRAGRLVPPDSDH